MEAFFTLLQFFEEAISAFPELYPSSNKNIRRAVLSKQVSIFYRVHKNRIEILSVLDNRSDLKDWL